MADRVTACGSGTSARFWAVIDGQKYPTRYPQTVWARKPFKRANLGADSLAFPGFEQLISGSRRRRGARWCVQTSLHGAPSWQRKKAGIRASLSTRTDPATLHIRRRTAGECARGRPPQRSSRRSTPPSHKERIFDACKRCESRAARCTWAVTRPTTISRYPHPLLRYPRPRSIVPQPLE